MRRPRSTIVALACLTVLCTAQPHAAAADVAVELAVIVNAGNPAQLSATDLEALFLRKQRHWGNGDEVIPFNYGPEDAERIMFDRVALGMTPDEVARYWLDQRIRAGVSPPREVGDAGLVVRLVGKLKTGIAYVPVTYDLRNVRVIARVRAGKLVSP